jgi:uncharacterized protein (TIGR03067 family)
MFWTRLKVTAVLLLALACAGGLLWTALGSAADRPKPQEAKPSDADRLEGVWKLVKVDGDAVKADGQAELFRELVLQRPQEDFTEASVAGSGRCFAQFRANPNKPLRLLDLSYLLARPLDGSSARLLSVESRYGIYRLDGDRLEVCLPLFRTSPSVRPIEFQGDAEAGVTVLTFQRKAGPRKPREEPDLKQLRGAWRRTGTPATVAEIRPGNRIEVTTESRTMRGTCLIDSSHSPAWIDVTIDTLPLRADGTPEEEDKPRERAAAGIYRLVKGKLHLRFGEAGEGRRPTDFDGTGGPELSELERVRKK